MFGRNKVAMVVAEFLGTFSLVSAMFAMLGRTTFPFFTAVAAASTLGVMSLVIGSVSGAHLNPALTISLWTRRKIETTTTIVYLAVQMLGGLVAWLTFEYLLDAPLKSIGGDRFVTRVFVAEAIGAFIFAFGFVSAQYQGYKGLRYAVVTGGALFLGILVASFGSNGLINPAVALGVKSWSLSYIAGPVVGALVGTNLYAWLFAPAAVAPKVIARVSTRRATLEVTKKPKTSQTKKRR